MKKVIVNQDTCIGCGTCVALASKSFKMTDNSKSLPLESLGDDEATVQNAIESCPVKAISWQE